jgi:uncharacterized membrane protein
MSSDDESAAAKDAAAQAEQKQQLRDSHIRSIIKAVSWRVVGTMDTFLVSFVALHLLGGGTTDTMHAAKAAGSIAGLEVFTKIILYYLHERAWSRLPLGSMRRFFGRDPKS